MNKKSYMTPKMRVFTCRERPHILSNSARSISGNSGIQMGGGGSGVARGRDFDDWGDEE